MDKTVAEIKAVPGQVQAEVTATVNDATAKAKAAPGNFIDKVTKNVRSTLGSAQADVKAQVEEAKRALGDVE